MKHTVSEGYVFAHLALQLLFAVAAPVAVPADVVVSVVLCYRLIFCARMTSLCDTVVTELIRL